MCGIAGFIQIEKKLPREEVARRAQLIADQMQYRGPDGSGAWTSSDGCVGLSHRRLAIIDLTPAGAQPMISADERYVITFNGEIYNFLELRQELEGQGIRFRSHSDTEVLLESYRRWGAEMLPKLDGMFAFAIYDNVTRETFMARDPFGEKPFYYAALPSFFAFSSELKSLLSIHEISDEISNDAVAEYLALQYIGAEKTLYKQIHKLLPAHWLRLDAMGNMETQRYFDFVPEQNGFRKESLDQLSEELESLLIQSLKRRLISDVPLGAFLSGGVDSSLTVALATKKLHKEIQTFSIGFTGTEDSEHIFAREFSAHLGTTHRDEMIEPMDVSFALELGKILDEPNGDTSCLPVYALSRLARKHVTVALSGDAGDELFGGYGRFFSSLSEAGAQQTKLTGGRQFEGINYYPRKLAVFSDVEVQRFMGDKARFLKSRLESMRLEMLLPETHYLSRLRQTDFRHYLPGAVLAKVDRMSMLNSLETRTPFLNLEVIRFAQSLPIQHMVQRQQGKLILKNIGSKYLPSEWLHRRKMGFGLPYSGWAQNAALNTFRDLCLDPNSKLQQWLDPKELRLFFEEQQKPNQFSLYRIWTLIVLESYLRANRHSVESSTMASTPIPTPQISRPDSSVFCENIYEDVHIEAILSASRKNAPIFSFVQGDLPKLVQMLPERNFVYSNFPIPFSSRKVSQRDWVQDWPQVFREIQGQCGKIPYYLLFPHGLPIGLTPFNCPANAEVLYKWNGHWMKFIQSKKMPVWKGLHFVSRILRRVIPTELSADRRSWKTWPHDIFEAPLPLHLHAKSLQVLEGIYPTPKISPSAQVPSKTGVLFQSRDHGDPLYNQRRYSAVKVDSLVGRSYLSTVRRLERFYLGEPTHSKDGGHSRTAETISKLIEKRRQEKLQRKSDSGKVMILTSSLGSGGAERQAIHLAKSLADQGQQVHLVSIHSLKDLNANDYYTDSMRLKNLAVYDLATPPSEPFPTQYSEDLETHNLIRDLFSSLDPFFAPDFFKFLHFVYAEKPQRIISFLDEPNLIAMMSGLIVGTQRILISLRNYGPQNFAFLNRPWFHSYYKALIPAPNVRISANSVRGMEDYLKWIGYQHPHAYYTPNGVDTSKFHSVNPTTRVELRKKWNLPDSQAVILGAFRMSPEKDPFLFIEVAQKIARAMPSSLFLVAGTGDLSKKIQSEIERLNLQGHFRIVGRESKMEELYNIADLILLTSHFEGTPNVLLESQLCGLPVVSTDVGDASSCFLDGKTGFLAKTRSADEISQLCLKILANKAEFRRATEDLGRAHIEENFSQKKMTESFINAIEA